MAFRQNGLLTWEPHAVCHVEAILFVFCKRPNRLLEKRSAGHQYDALEDRPTTFHLRPFEKAFYTKTMDVVRELPEGSNAFLAITNSKSANILAFYWDGSAIEAFWVMRNRETHVVRGLERMDSLHFLAADIGHTVDEKGRIRLHIGLLPQDNPFGPLFVVEAAGGLEVVYKRASDQAIVRLEEIFMDVEKKPVVTSYCKSSVRDTGHQFVTTLTADMGPIAAFL